MRRILFWTACAFAVAAAGLVALVPRETTATATFTFAASPAEVWAVFTDPASQPAWRPGVAEVLMRDENRLLWTETTDQGLQIDFAVEEATPAERLVLSLASPAGFTGRYTAEFAADGDRTVGTFTESIAYDGFVPALMAFLFVDQDAFLRAFAEAAAAEVARRRGSG